MRLRSILAISYFELCEQLTVKRQNFNTLTDCRGARIIDEMRRLIDKYPGGFDEWEKSQQQATGPADSE